MANLGEDDLRPMNRDYFQSLEKERLVELANNLHQLALEQWDKINFNSSNSSQPYLNYQNNNQLNCGSKTILIVDDIPDNLELLSMLLGQEGYLVCCAHNGNTALLSVKKQPPDLILLDIKMPDMDGYEICAKLKADQSTRHIPIIFLSALNEVSDKGKAFSVGGVDYITKPFQIEEVIIRIQHQLALQAAKAEIFQLNSQLEQKVKQRTTQLEQVINNLNQEIIEHQCTQEKLLEQALYDGLTGLPNRILFMEHLQKALQRHQRNPDYLFAVLFIDLDRFKIINDSLGHSVGDKLLIAISRMIKRCCRETETVARLSGDEFTILIEDLNDFTNAKVLAERLLKKFSTPIHLGDRKVFSGASIGIALGGTNYKNGVDVLRDADIAMYRAKSLGKGRYAVFDQQMYAQTLYLSQLETDLRLAVERQELFLNYQPIIDLKTGRIIGFEVLVRWQHPRTGLIAPGEFIGLAEDTGLIIPIGEWILREACQQLRTWQEKFPLASSVHLSVNLSGRQVKQFDFVEKLAKILADTGLEGQNLHLELTETMLMDQGEKTIELLSQIKEQNIQLSIDDFGTGYSSLSYLHRFPIDVLKIDRSFVRLIDRSPENCAIVKTIITLAHSLGMKAIAEGVETPTQLTYLRNLDCEAVQGFLFAKPLSPKLAESFIDHSLIGLKQKIK